MDLSHRNFTQRVCLHVASDENLPKLECQSVVNGNPVHLLATISNAPEYAQDNSAGYYFCLSVFIDAADGLIPLAHAYIEEPNVENANKVLDRSLVPSGWTKYDGWKHPKPAENLILDDPDLSVKFFNTSI